MVRPIAERDFRAEPFAQGRGAARNRIAGCRPEIGFHAIGAGADAKISVIGYEDVKSRFYGMGSTYAPDSLLGLAAPRDPKDEGLLYGFEPCASLRVEVELAAAGATELIIVDGWARDMGRATDSIARHLGIAPVAPETLNKALSRRRGLILPPPPKKPRYAFSQDGRSVDACARHAASFRAMSSPTLSDRARCSRMTAKFSRSTAIRA